MAIFETVLKSDLKKPVQVKQLSGNLFSGDNQGNKITAEVMDNGSPATLSGGVTGYVIREDNSTVIISSGTLSGNKASIVLPEEAYNVVGRVSIVVKVGTTTVGACTAYVYRTSTDTLVDPTGAIPSLQELLAKISACEQATADANKVANLTVSAEAATGSTPDAVLSETGSPAHKHITFKLVKGDKGDPGDTGATPQLSIGTVTTLQPSQDATATLTGTDEDPVLNLGIPQGESGNETIDDTAGLGDTDLVYSADKLTKELSQKANGENVYSYKSKSGSIVTVDDAVAEAVKQMRIEIAPVQDLHGYENPWPAGGGKNLLELLSSNLKTLNTDGSWSDNVYTLNGLTFTVQLNDTGAVTGINVKGTASATTNFIFVASALVNNTEYILNGCPSGGGTDSYGVMHNTQSTIADYGSGKTFTKTDSIGQTFRIRVASGYAFTSAGLMFYPMIRLSSVSDATFAPYSNICPISGWMGAKVTRTGKNLISCDWNNQTSSSKNVDFTYTGNHLTASGTANGTNTDTSNIPLTHEVLLKAGVT